MVSSGGSLTVESSHTTMDISSNTKGQTGEIVARRPAQEEADSQVRDHDVDEDNSVV